nr:RNA-dependent RNA polymerase [Erysiphe necator associated negative-stranded RNA virus 14]
MSFTTREAFQKNIFVFSKGYELKMEIEDEIVEVELLRYINNRELMKKSGIVITPKEIFVSMELNEEKFSKDNIVMYMADPSFMKFHLEMDKNSCFSPSGRAYDLETNYYVTADRDDDGNVMRRINITAKEYMMMSGESKIDNRVISRYNPSMSEVGVYKDILEEFKLFFPCGEMDKSNMDRMVRESSKVNEVVEDFYNSEFLLKKYRETEKGLMKFEDASTYFDTELQEKLTLKKINKWMHTRHNLFGVAVCMEMSWTVFSEFDVDVASTFNYNGTERRLTPDYFFEAEDKIYLLDFAVTVGNSAFIRERKQKKYKLLAEELSFHLKKEVVADAIVWRINEMDNMQIPAFLEPIRENLINNEMLRNVRLMHLRLMQMENYNLFAKNLDVDLVDWDESTEIKFESYSNLLTSMLDLYRLEDKKTNDIKVSRNLANKGEKIMLKNMEFMEELRNSLKVDEMDYFRECTNTMMNMVKTDTIPDYLKQVTTFNKEKVFYEIDKQKSSQERIRLDCSKQMNFKIPKVFKFPFFSYKKFHLEEMDSLMHPNFVVQEEFLDGTMLINDKMKWLDKEKINEDFDYLTKGIGFDEIEDKDMIESLIEFMMQEMEDNSMDIYCGEMSDNNFYKQLVNSRLWEVTSFISELMENICYLEGRRHVINKRDGHTAMKRFSNYTLLVRKGSKMTAKNQIKYKIFCNKEFIEFSDTNIFHNWYDFEDDSRMMQTKWLTISITDIRHFIRGREVLMSLASDYQDKLMEVSKIEDANLKVLDKPLVTMMLLFLEHKRGTSTSLQLNRYLMHSALGYITWREKLVRDINSSPIRSRLESYVRIMQLNWYHVMMNNVEENWTKRITKMASTDTSYDRVFMPSFFDTSQEVEFSMAMNEIYVGNLFDKDAGFMDHRIKGIVSKMTEAEKHYMLVRESKFSQGKVDNIEEFLNSPDELHTFDLNFVVSATKIFFKKKHNIVMLMDSLVKSLSDTIEPAMMMTSSLVSGPYQSEVLSFSEKVKKSKSFLTLFDEIENSSTFMLTGLVSMEEYVEAIFTLFPKAQIGGPREILIQSVKLRIMVKLLETISKNFSEKHEKEMLTKHRKKAEMQSDKMTAFKDLLIFMKKKGEICLYGSLNADATKWAPGFVMEHFAYFVYNWEMDERLKNFLCTVIVSFSYKVILTPEMLKDKWMKKPKNEKEDIPAVQDFREMSEESGGAPVLFSGMGQGMLHFLSSIYHTVMDDMVDMIIEEILMKLYQTRINQTTLISSDDKTKMMIFNFPTVDVAEDAMKCYIKVIDMSYRLANIHSNWKKSALQFTITEFNSLFSIGKRMCWATVKDLYTAHMVPDLTCPEEAVNFMMSSIRRCMEHGVYLTTIKNLMYMAREQLKRYYRYTPDLVQQMMNELGCTEDTLPTVLGFIPKRYMVESLLFGTEFLMFDNKNTDSLNLFYKNLYTASNDTNLKRSRKYVPFDETGSGKFWFELPTRLDKKLIDLKKDFYENRLNKTQEEVICEMNNEALDVHITRNDWKHYKSFRNTFFVGMNRKYEFQETMVVHSLVRALQLSNSKAVIFPNSLEMTELMDTIDEKKIEMSKMMNETEKAKKELEELNNNLSDMSTDVIGFIRFISDRSKKVSTIFMLNNLKDLITMLDKANSEIDNMSRSKRNSHPKMRQVNFHMEDIGLSSKAEDLLNFMFDPSKDLRNSTINSFNRLMEVFNFNRDSCIKNPFKFIRETFKDMEYGYKAFMEFLRYNSKMAKNISINMMSDFPCTGNLYGNLINYLRSRSSPVYLYYRSDSMVEEKVDLNFLTLMSINGSYSEEIQEIPEVMPGDNRISMSRKLCSYGVNVWTNMNMIKNKRLFYSEKYDNKQNIKYKYWTDLKMIARAKEILRGKDTKVEMAITTYDEMNIDDNPNMVVLMRYVEENKNRNLYYLTKEKMSDTTGLMFSLMDKKGFMFMAEKKEMVSKWTLKLKVVNSMEMLKKSKFPKSKFLGNIVKNGIEGSFSLMDDRYSVSQDSLKNIKVELFGHYENNLLDAIHDPPSIEVLDKILLDKSWISMDLFKEKEDESEESSRKYDISEINKQMAQANIMDLIPKLTRIMEANENHSSNESEETKMNFDSFLGAGLGAIKKSLLQSRSYEESDDNPDNEILAYERISVMKYVEKVVHSACNSFIRFQSQIAKTRYEDMLNNQFPEAFHNMLLWEIKYNYQNISDTMLLMIYNILLKKITTNSMISPMESLKIKNPPKNTVETILKTPMVIKINEAYRSDVQDMVRAFM